MSKRCMGCMENYDNEYEICPHCGYVEGTPAEEAIHMDPKTLLHNRYIIGKVLGFGGFGVTYVAWDGKLEQKVAIKEYLPSEFSTRMPGQTSVTVFNGDKGEQFNDGMTRFVEEAKRLAKFQDEPGVVKVYDSFLENDTAYIVMEFLDGETLSERLKRETVIPENEAVEMLMPVMKSLHSVHQERILHRDIAPDNIFITKSGEVKLIDFGASRYATTSHSRSLTVIIKPGFSPEEQYRSRGDQGAYTDVYALAATLYKMITGKTPPDAMERRAKYENSNKDILEEPHKINKKISLNRENAILNAMNVRIEDRTPNVAAFMKELDANPPAKRIYGKIKKLDLYTLPIWVKVIAPVVACIGIVFGALMLTGVIDFEQYVVNQSIPDGYVVVPDLYGLTANEVDKKLEGLGLEYEIDMPVESEYLPEDKVVYQSIRAGRWTTKEYPFKIKFAIKKGGSAGEDGLIKIPSVGRMNVEAAKELLVKEGVPADKIKIKKENSNEIAKDLVIMQDPEGGETFKEEHIENITITLIISNGFETPDIVGLKLEEAKKVLKENNLEEKNLGYVESDLPEGTIVSQSPKAGEFISAYTKVEYTISSGPDSEANKDDYKKVPDVVNKTKTEAIRLLEQAGFKVTYKTIPDGKRDVVSSQNPVANTMQKKGSEVVIFVGSGIEEDKTIEISFDAMGGSVSTSEKVYDINSIYGSLPKAERNGYIFKGWYTDSEGGSNVKEDQKVTKDAATKLYARWEAKTFTVTLNGNTGTPAEKTVTVTFGKTYGTALSSNLPKKEGYGFAGWKTEDGKTVSANDKVDITGDIVLYAQWSANSITVTLDASEGTISGDSILTIKYGEYYSGLTEPERTGYIFEGWYLDGNEVTENTKVTRTDSHTLYAKWTPRSVTVTLNANGGTVSHSSITVKFGSSYSDLPADPVRDGYTFSDWTDANGYSVTSSTKVTNVSNHTLYANWTPKKVTVTLNANGGKVSPSSVEVTFDSTYVGLPTNPTKDYNNFVGWYDENGNVVTSSTKVTNASSHTLYAKWTLKPLSPWMPASSLPNGAEVVEQKWTYTKTETTTSTASSLSGWTQTGSSWRQTGSGTHYYASYPSGFSTSHSLYFKYNKSALTSYENASNKREVSAASQYTYIYWHWTYRDDSYGHDRLIGDKYSPSSTYLQNNIYFHAFETTESASLRSGSTKVYNSTTLSTPPKFGSSKWWYRFSVYKQTYTDYEKLYSYKKVTNGLESATQVYASDTVSNVQHMIRYREK